MVERTSQEFWGPRGSYVSGYLGSEVQAVEAISQGCWGLNRSEVAGVQSSWGCEGDQGPQGPVDPILESQNLRNF